MIRSPGNEDPSQLDDSVDEVVQQERRDRMNRIGLERRNESIDAGLSLASGRFLGWVLAVGARMTEFALRWRALACVRPF